MYGDDDDTYVAMGIEEREAELGYSDAAYRHREQANDPVCSPCGRPASAHAPLGDGTDPCPDEWADREQAIERAQCELCGVWLAEHGTDCP